MQPISVCIVHTSYIRIRDWNLYEWGRNFVFLLCSNDQYVWVWGMGMGMGMNIKLFIVICDKALEQIIL